MRQLDPVPQKNEWIKREIVWYLVKLAFTERVAGKKSVIVSRAQKYKGKTGGIQLALLFINDLDAKMIVAP